LATDAAVAMPNAEPQRRDEAEERHEQHSGRRIEPEEHRHDQREAAVEPGAEPDPEHLRGHELLHVHGGRQDGVVGPLEALLHEGAEHGGQGAREDHGGGHHAGADELHVVEPVHPVDDRGAETEPERQQVDHRLEDAREGGGLPEGAEVRDLAAHNAADRRGLEPSHCGSTRLGRVRTDGLTPPPRR